MDKRSLLVTSAIAGLFAVSTVAAQAHSPKLGKDKEKCVGVAKAGMNDCGTSTHSCAGQSKIDGDANEWMALPKGTCERIVGGKVVQSEAKPLPKN